MGIFDGICPALATPFSDSENVDFESLENLIQVQAQWGCKSVIALAFAAEYYKLTEDETHNVAQTIIKSCLRFGLKSIVSISTHATDLAVSKAREYADMGADAILLIPPFIIKPDLTALAKHILRVCNATPLPVILQYSPEVSGISLSSEKLLGLREQCESLSCFKIECPRAPQYVSQLIESSCGSVKALVGNAGITMIESLDRGASGIVPGCSLTDVYLKVYRDHQEGNRCSAFARFDRLHSLIHSIHQSPEMLFHYEKMILYQRGIISTPVCRSPSIEQDLFIDRLFTEGFARLKDDLMEPICSKH